MTSIRKAFTMRASSIGDCLMGTYLLENIHAQYPDAECSIVVASRVGMIRDLLSAYPWLSVHEASRRNPRAIFSVVRALWRSDATETQCTGRGQFSTPSKIFARLVTRRGRLVGYQDPWKWNSLLYDHVLPYDHQKALLLHEQSAVMVLGVPVTIRKPVLKYIPDVGVHERFALPTKSYIILHLFAGTGGRGFTRERRIALVRMMQETFGSRYTIVLTGGASDETYADEVAQGFPVRVLAGKTTVQELANLIVGSAGVVSIDTGVAHMTAQLGISLVVTRSCFAYNWWSKDQYDGSVLVLSNDAVCSAGHRADRADNCLNSVPVEEIIHSAQIHFEKDFLLT